MQPTQSYTPEAIAKAIDTLADELAQAYAKRPNVAVVGIANGGVALASILASKLSKALDKPIPCGTVDITFQRDDIGKHLIPRITQPTELPFDIHHARIILVDDVLFTGRTVRAALNELFDQGRPSRVELAVLFDRGNHRLPIIANYAAFTQEVPTQAKVKVTIDSQTPSNHSLTIHE